MFWFLTYWDPVLKTYSTSAAGSSPWKLFSCLQTSWCVPIISCRLHLLPASRCDLYEGYADCQLFHIKSWDSEAVFGLPCFGNSEDIHPAVAPMIVRSNNELRIHIDQVYQILCRIVYVSMKFYVNLMSTHTAHPSLSSVGICIVLYKSLVSWLSAEFGPNWIISAMAMWKCQLPSIGGPCFLEHRGRLGPWVWLEWPFRGCSSS